MVTSWHHRKKQEKPGNRQKNSALLKKGRRVMVQRIKSKSERQDLERTLNEIEKLNL